ncbi:hypothetical protein OHU11_19165 [Streptomyces sp. NBC_00257]|uniref:hypothetical protein n=1 Tax=unclassified Streptomyces TaxID=2593676 RepID=UPI00225077AF|nr:MULTISPECIES: hypothetical protein [unclassified Streptomyces]WTB56037.1 hypothetical protein OG832_24230 [Streptomyces sp. NBC_00826]WTH95617.1 hypothetical protein OIC43_19465 [Streptomyces sp. NBC_00825]WTI04347.1 hypothetical protein OHA23_19450 [Streptomyces sp. NBC_00822]MCX4865271.1 hypothetical protein [Streptomyces sp. NBC_00906]MCX4896509.1 hypothetical protein [Streptomyces sp. NBC_00892]
MIRNVLGSVLALAGAAAAVLSPFRDWYDGRLGRHYRVDELFTGITAGRPGPLGSILVAFLFAAVLAVVGVVLRSRLLVAAAGVVVLGFTVLWMVRQGESVGSLTVAGDGSGLGWGVAGAAAGGVLLLLGAAVMSGRRGAGRRSVRKGHDRPYAAPGSENPDTWPPTQEPGPSVQTSTLPEPEPELYTGPDPAERHRPARGPGSGSAPGSGSGPDADGRPHD